MIDRSVIQHFQSFLNSRFTKLGQAIARQQACDQAFSDVQAMLDIAAQDLDSANRKVAHETQFNLSPECAHWWANVNKFDPHILYRELLPQFEAHGFEIDEDFKLSVQYLLSQPPGTKSFPGYAEWVKEQKAHSQT